MWITIHSSKRGKALKIELYTKLSTLSTKNEAFWNDLHKKNENIRFVHMSEIAKNVEKTLTFLMSKIDTIYYG